MTGVLRERAPGAPSQPVTEIAQACAKLAAQLPAEVPRTTARLTALLLLADPPLSHPICWSWSPWLPVADETTAGAVAAASSNGFAQTLRRRHLSAEQRWCLTEAARRWGTLPIDDLAAAAREHFLNRNAP